MFHVNNHNIGNSTKILALVFSFSFFFESKSSLSPGWFHSQGVSEEDLELLNLFPPLLSCYYRHILALSPGISFLNLCIIIIIINTGGLNIGPHEH